MARVYFPHLYWFKNELPREHWPCSRILRTTEGVCVLWKGAPDKLIGPMQKIHAYTEYRGQPLFIGENEAGIVLGYKDIAVEAGVKLQGDLGIVEDQMFFVSQFDDGWYLVWGDQMKALLGQSIVRPALDIRPRNRGKEFDALYIAREEKGLMAVYNNCHSRVFDHITHHSYQAGRLLVCGMRILPNISDPEATHQWFVDLGDKRHGPYSNVFDFMVDTKEKRVRFYGGNEESAERIEISLAA